MKGKIFCLMLVLGVIFSISAVCADDLNDTGVISSDDSIKSNEISLNDVNDNCFINDNQSSGNEESVKVNLNGFENTGVQSSQKEIHSQFVVHLFDIHGNPCAGQCINIIVYGPGDSYDDYQIKELITDSNGDVTFDFVYDSDYATFILSNEPNSDVKVKLNIMGAIKNTTNGGEISIFLPPDMSYHGNFLKYDGLFVYRKAFSFE